MQRRFSGWLLIAFGLLGATAAFGVSHAADDPKVPEKGKDLHGDVLPPGALARMGTVRWRHPDTVTFVAFTPDRKGLLAASQDGFICLWDRASGKQNLRVSTGGQKPAPAAVNRNMAQVLDLSHDGKVLATAQGNAIQLWDMTSGNEIRQIPVPGNGVMAIAFSPNGKMLAVRGSDRAVHVLETDSGKVLRQIKANPPKAGGGVRVVFGGGFGGASGMAYSPDSKVLACGETELNNQKLSTYLKLTNLETGNEVRRIDAAANGVGAIGAIAYSPDGKVLAYAGTNVVHLHEADTGKEIRQINVQMGASALIFSPDSKTLAGKGRDLVIRLWETETGKTKREIGDVQPIAPGNVVIFRGGFTAEARDIAFSPDGKTIAGGGTQTVRMWDTDSGKELPLMGGHRGKVSAVTVTPDGKTLLSFGADNYIRRWDAATGNELGEFPVPAGTTSIAFAPDSATVALGVSDTTIRVHDTTTGKEVYQIKGHINGTGALAFSPNGKLLASRGASDGAIRVYTAANGHEVKQISLPNANVPGNPGGLIIVNGGIRSSAQSLVFSPDGQRIAAHISTSPVMLRMQGQPQPAAPGDTLHVWDVTTGKELRKITMPAGRGVHQIAYSPDGRVIAAENNDYTVTLWEISSGRERDQLGSPGPKMPAGGAGGWAMVGGGFGNFAAATAVVGRALAYSPDGALLAVKGPNNAVRVWQVNTSKVIGQLGGHTGPVSCVAFGSGGKTVISGSQDTTALVWDAAALKRDTAPAPADLQTQDLEKAWADLIGDDAGKAFRGILKLAAAPNAAAFLRDRLPAAKSIDIKVIDKLITDLGSDNYKSRTKASADLEAMGELAIPALQKVLASKVPLETRRRVEPLLEKLTTGTLSAEQLRLVRAVEALERLGTSDARQALETLSRGAPGALPTVQAQASLARQAARP